MLKSTGRLHTEKPVKPELGALLDCLLNELPVSVSQSDHAAEEKSVVIWNEVIRHRIGNCNLELMERVGVLVHLPHNALSLNYSSLSHLFHSILP